MINILILTHGGLARELLAAARVIAGELPGFEALSLDWNEVPEALEREVEGAIRQIDQGDGVLILTDMYGGTPSNVAAHFQQPGRVEVVSGVNLPMVLRLGCRMGNEGKTLGELADWLQEKGRQSVRRLEESGTAAADRWKSECPGG